MAAPPTLLEVSVLLAAVKALLREASAEDWMPNVQVARFLDGLAAFLVPHLPPEAFTSRTLALAYLLTAAVSLEGEEGQLLEKALP